MNSEKQKRVVDKLGIKPEEWPIVLFVVLLVVVFFVGAFLGIVDFIGKI